MVLALSRSLCSRHILLRPQASALSIRHNHVADLSFNNSRLEELVQLGRITEAWQLFDEMPDRDTFTWNLMISGYSKSGSMEEARSLFEAFTPRNSRTWTMMISGYCKIGLLQEARLLFDSMPRSLQNPVPWNAMISGYVQDGDINMARRLFDEMPTREVSSWNAIINGYCHSHRMDEARHLFEQMPMRNLASWTVMMFGYAQINDHMEAWRVFVKLHHSGGSPDLTCFSTAVSALVGIGDLKMLDSLRSLGIKTDFEGDVVVGTTILNAYVNGGLDDAIRYFDGMQERNEYSWSKMISALCRVGRLDDALAIYDRDPDKSIASRTALLTGFALNGRIHDARSLFENSSSTSVVSWNAMISGYMNNSMVDEARELFDRMPSRNDISWAAMIAGYAQNGRSEEALELLSRLHRLGMLPSVSCFTSGLFACASIRDVDYGRQLHTLVLKAGCQLNLYVNNGLIAMYRKCKNMKV